MSRQLTNTETEELFEVCERQGVYHFDVRMEFVDHLATSIEKIWERKPDVDFETAKQKALNNFGVRNLNHAYHERVKELRRKYNRMLWRYVLEFYNWPKVVMTFVFTLGLFMVFQLVPHTRHIIIVYAILLAIAIVLYHIFVYPKVRVKTDWQKPFVILDYMKVVRSTSILLVQIPLCGWSFLEKIKPVQNTWVLLGIAFLIVFLNVFLYAHFFYIPQRVHQHFMETYPQFVKQ